MSRLSFYIESPYQFDWLASYNIHTVIIDCPFCSIRSHTPYDWSNDELMGIRNQLPESFLALNMDGLYSDHELRLIEMTIKTRSLDRIFTAFRIQDPGLMLWIKETFPNCVIQFNPETGFQNIPAIASAFGAGASLVTLNHETPYSTIQAIQKECEGNEFELLVQGPILIQYSRRRFLSDLDGSDPKIPIRLTAKDAELPNRNFVFLNTPFGHLMFAQFHRSLAKYAKKLLPLTNAIWLIDSRGESDAYAQTALELYATLEIRELEWIDQAVTKLETLSNRPQKPGFFLSNQTDMDWRDHQIPSNQSQIGRVLSAKKNDALLLQLFVNGSNQATILCRNPDGTSHEFSLKGCVSLTGEILNEVQPFEPVMISNAIKGIQANGALYWI
jgi:collagenase-like PrtC family protease